MISTELKVKLHKTFKQLLPACDLRVCPKIFSILAKSSCNFKLFDQTIEANFEQKHLLSTVIFVLI